MKKIFKFDSMELDMIGIKPIKNFIPQWYKNIPTAGKKNVKLNTDGTLMKTAKNCSPFLDSLITGYTIPLWSDVHISYNHGGLNAIWTSDVEVMSSRSTDSNLIPIPSGHNEQHLIWKIPYAIKLPPGYSAIFTHPMNRFDLPFTTLSGIVDADYDMNGGNMPFFIKNDFQGIIEKGTPIVQIIPFKRENWISENDKELAKKALVSKARATRVFYGWYKENIWKNKRYE